MKFTFSGHTGYIIAPWVQGTSHQLVALRHSASVLPWADQDIHIHEESEEYYFLFQGELVLYIDRSVFNLLPHEVLMVKPGIPHAVIGGNGRIEHFLIRVPALDDRKVVEKVPPTDPTKTGRLNREMVCAWGSRLSLLEAKNQNCWLFGVDQARFHSEQFCLAYLNYSTNVTVENDIGISRHRPHLHQNSWEYYTVLKGTKILEVDGEFVEINAGEILEVSPHTKHVLREIRPPFEGFTFRVPRLDDKIEF